MFLFFSYINVFKGKISYEDTPGIVVTVSYANCFCWCIYGKLIYSNQIKICNLIGAVSSFFLISIYLLYESKKYTLDAILNSIIIIAGLYAIYRGFTIVIEDDSIIGKICIGISCLVFLSPIQIIYRVLREKNYNLIPIYSAYISIILAAIQILIFHIYKKRYTTIGEKESSSTIGIESNENNKKGDMEIKIEDESQSKMEAKPVKIISKMDN